MVRKHEWPARKQKWLRQFGEQPIAQFFHILEGIPHTIVVFYTPSTGAWGIREFFWSIEHDEWLIFEEYMALDIRGDIDDDMEGVIDMVLDYVTLNIMTELETKSWFSALSGEFMGEWPL